jgi:S1-C subfamily serine protease
MGAGVAVGPRQVLTAHYLVLGASQAVVVAGDGRIREARRVSLDHEAGLALLTVDGPDLRPAPLGRSAHLRPGKPVFLLTCTGEQERKGASGLVASVGPFEAFWEYMLDEAIMTTVLNPGLAGAPLFDYDARVVGIVSLGLAAVGRYSLAIPVDLFLAHRSILEGSTERTQQRAWLGVYPQGNDGAVAITGVVPGGPADRALGGRPERDLAARAVSRLLEEGPGRPPRPAGAARLPDPNGARRGGRPIRLLQVARSWPRSWRPKMR